MTKAMEFGDLTEIKWDNGRALKGANSAYGTCNGNFLKIITRKPEIHELLIGEKIEFTPKLIDYRFVNDKEFNDFTRKNSLNLKIRMGSEAYLYIFEKINLEEIPILIKKEGITKEIIKNLLTSSISVFNKLNKHGYAYHDACWKNIIWNKDSNEAFIIDIDSAIFFNRKIEEIKGAGQQTFQQVYLSMKGKYQRKLDDLQFLDLCIITNLFFSFAIGYYFNDLNKFLNEDHSANKIARTLIANEAQNDGDLKDFLNDPVINNVLTNALVYLNESIENQNVDHINNLINLVDYIPQRTSFSCPKCKFVNAADEIYCQSCAYQLVGMQKCRFCDKDIPVKTTFCPMCGSRL